jgi:hypothetical protein
VAGKPLFEYAVKAAVNKGAEAALVKEVPVRVVGVGGDQLTPHATLDLLALECVLLEVLARPA